MFYHNKKLQYYTPPQRPDPVYAKKMQELIGGFFGEDRNDAVCISRLELSWPSEI